MRCLLAITPSTSTVARLGERIALSVPSMSSGASLVRLGYGGKFQSSVRRGRRAAALSAAPQHLVFERFVESVNKSETLTLNVNYASRSVPGRLLGILREDVAVELSRQPSLLRPRAPGRPAAAHRGLSTRARATTSP